MWDHMDGSKKYYHCASDIYLLSCLALEFYIIIYRAVEEPIHRKDVVVGLNSRIKWMLKLSISKLLNSDLIQDDPIFQFHVGS